MHIVLAYSGGLDTSVAVHWLQQAHDAKVTCALIDLGQPLGDLEAAKERALHNGAEAVHIIDAKHEFVTDHVAPAIQANALYQGMYPLATALGRPLIAKKLVEVAMQVGADAIAHGCTGKGNDQVRLEAGIKSYAPHLKVLAPQRTHPMTRPEVLRYAAAHDLALPPISDGTYSIDENLYGRSAEGDGIEDPAQPVPEDAFAWTKSPIDAPMTPLDCAITFEGGIPTAIDGVPMGLQAIIQNLNEAAGQHGIGRIDMVEDRLIGIKSREVYEAPAAMAILAAKKALEQLTLTGQEQRHKAAMEQQFAQMVYDAQWTSPLMQAIQAYIETMQANVSGVVKMRFYKGQATPQGVESQVSLFDHALATYGDDDAFTHEDASGFIALHSLPMEVASKARTPPVVQEHPWP